MNLNLPLEIKALEGRQFEGHGSVFNNMDLTGDVIAPGAFKASLGEHKAAGTVPQMFWMHKADQVPGVWLKMLEDSRGLYVKGELADTQLGNEMYTLLKMKAVSGLSIGFRTRDAEWIEDETRGVYRLLKEIELWEVSLVSLAANPLAQISSVKSRLSATGEYVPTVREVEHKLRGAGFSKRVVRDMMVKLNLGGMLSEDDVSDAGGMLVDDLKRLEEVISSASVLEDKPWWY